MRDKMLRGIRIFTAVGTVAATLAAVPALATTPSASSQPRTDANARALRQLESGILQEINGLRRRHGLAPLRLSTQLAAAAEQHSQSMVTGGYFAHESADGSPFWKRVRRYYVARGWSSWSAGENLLWSSPDLNAARALQLWLASPPHRENMLNARWRDIGLSAVHAAAAPGTYEGLEVTIVTADFGVRR